MICAHKFRTENLVQDAHAVQSAIPGKRPNEPRAQWIWVVTISERMFLQAKAAWISNSIIEKENQPRQNDQRALQWLSNHAFGQLHPKRAQ
jgi:hypothetical protein